jgi:hypothetical protein
MDSEYSSYISRGYSARLLKRLMHSAVCEEVRILSRLHWVSLSNLTQKLLANNIVMCGQVGRTLFFFFFFFVAWLGVVCLVNVCYQPSSCYWISYAPVLPSVRFSSVWTN